MSLEGDFELYRALKGIVFDAVGTLIEPEPSVAAAYRSAALEQGVELDQNVIRARFIQAYAIDEVDASKGAFSTDEETERRRWRRIVAAVLPEIPDLDTGFAELWEHFGRPRSWRVFDDVEPTLQVLKSLRLPTCIASNFDGRLRRLAADLPGLTSLVDTLVISSEVGYRKPHPLFYHCACARLGLQPGEVLSVGDDLENDIAGPLRAGLMGGVLVDRKGRASGDLPRVSSLSELADRLVTHRSVA